MADSISIKWTVTTSHLGTIIKGMEPIARQAVAKAALDIEAQAKVRAPVDTGTLKNSIQARQVGGNAASGSVTWRVVVGADYGIYVEYGTVHMPARPYLHPAVNAVRPAFLAAMKEICQ